MRPITTWLGGGRLLSVDESARLGILDEGSRERALRFTAKHSVTVRQTATLGKEQADQAMRVELEAALARAGGNVPLAAQTLGIDRTSLYRRAKRLGVKLVAGKIGLPQCDTSSR